MHTPQPHLLFLLPVAPLYLRWLSSAREQDGTASRRGIIQSQHEGRVASEGKRMQAHASHPPVLLVSPLALILQQMWLSSALQQGGTVKQLLLQGPGPGYKWGLTWRLAHQSEQGPAWSLQGMAEPQPCPRLGAAAAGAPVGSALRGLRLAQAAGVGRPHGSCGAH